MFVENCNGFTLFCCKFPQISSFKAIFFLFYDIFLCFSSGQLYSCMCVISGKNCPEADFCPTTSEDHFRFCLVNVDSPPPPHVSAIRAAIVYLRTKGFPCAESRLGILVL